MADDDFERASYIGLYRVEIDDVEIGTFRDVTGLTVEMKVEEIKEGGTNDYVHKMPGPLSWPNITLKRGVIKTDELFEWFTEVSSAALGAEGFERRDGCIVALDEKREPVRRWNLTGALPVKWKGPDFSSSGSDAAVEELEIAHHGFTAGT